MTGAVLWAVIENVPTENASFAAVYRNFDEAVNVAHLFASKGGKWYVAKVEDPVDWIAVT